MQLLYILSLINYKYNAKTHVHVHVCILTLERMDGSAEMTAERAFIALVLMATALSLSTLRICVVQVNMYSCSNDKNLTTKWRFYKKCLCWGEDKRGREEVRSTLHIVCKGRIIESCLCLFT